MARKTATPPKKGAKKTAVKSAAPVKVAQDHGGALYAHGVRGNPGGGRPRDVVRNRLLRLANGKGIPFLKSLFNGDVEVRYYGTCVKCGHRQELPEDDEYMQKILDEIGDKVRASVDHRLKGLDQALRYGVGTKDEMDIMSHPDAQRFVTAYRQALDEIVPVHAEVIVARVSELLGKAA